MTRRGELDTLGLKSAVIDALSKSRLGERIVDGLPPAFAPTRKRVLLRPVAAENVGIDDLALGMAFAWSTAQWLTIFTQHRNTGRGKPVLMKRPERQHDMRVRIMLKIVIGDVGNHAP